MTVVWMAGYDHKGTELLQDKQGEILLIPELKTEEGYSPHYILLRFSPLVNLFPFHLFLIIYYIMSNESVEE